MLSRYSGGATVRGDRAGEYQIRLSLSHRTFTEGVRRSGYYSIYFPSGLRRLMIRWQSDQVNASE